MKLTATISPEYDGQEIKKYMEKELFMSSQMIKRLKLHGRVEVNGEHRRVRELLKSGDSIYLEYDDDAKINPDCGIKIYYEDEWFVVCEKPSGVVTHPTHGHLDDSLTTIMSNDTLHPVMRLDRETSGLIVIAKNGYAHSSLLSKGNIEKRYIAAVYGKFEPLTGIIDLPIKRREGSVMIRDCAPDGKPSTTLYNNFFYDEKNNISLVEYKLLTGRCHQIRTHSRTMGHPLIGDGLYGPNSIDNPCDLFSNSIELDKTVGRCSLHAYHLKIHNPFTGEDMVFKSSLPTDIKSVFCSEGLDEALSKFY